MIDASKYTITVRKGVFDGEECFEARRMGCGTKPIVLFDSFNDGLPL